MNAPQNTPSAIFSGSTSGSTMPASLPPSSRVSLDRLPALASTTFMPVFTEPVNMTLPIRVSRTSGVAHVARHR